MENKNSNVVIIQYITDKQDLLYGKPLSDKDIQKAVGPILETSRYFGVPVHLLTNAKTSPNLPGLKTIHMDLFDYDNLSVYFHRIEMTFNYLLQHPEISKVAAVDAGDVKMLNYPFDKIENNRLYLGVENIKIRDAWIIKENSNPDFINKFFLENGHLLMVSPGISIGTREVMLEYYGMMAKIISEAKVKQLNGIPGFNLGNYEMALGSYVAHKYFHERLVYGREISTKFSAWEFQSSAWFQHK
jgi:hypothetical protein